MCRVPPLPRLGHFGLCTLGHGWNKSWYEVEAPEELDRIRHPKWAKPAIKWVPKMGLQIAETVMHTWDDAGSSLSIALTAELKWSDLSDRQMAHLRYGANLAPCHSCRWFRTGQDFVILTSQGSHFTKLSGNLPRICTTNARMILQRLQNWHKLVLPSPNTSNTSHLSSPTCCFAFDAGALTLLVLAFQGGITQSKIYVKWFTPN